MTSEGLDSEPASAGTSSRIRLYLAPAAAGKTAYVLQRARAAAQGLQATPRVVVPAYLPARALHRRLARTGGGIGVRVLTFDRLYVECLNAAGEVYTELSEPVQYRLIRTVVDDLPLDHYAPLVGRPGLVQVLKNLIQELKAARVTPAQFARAVAHVGDEPRLRDLARVYATYQERLLAHGWADRAGLGWLAVEALEERAPDVARDWTLLAVDGFDDFSPIQLALLQVLADRVGELVVTLTGAADESARPLAHHRFQRTRRQLEQILGVRATPLPETTPRAAPALAHLEANLFRTPVPRASAAGAVNLIAAPDRAAEVRAALRWLKARLVDDGLRPGQVALLARDVPPYRSFIQQVAAEFELPVRLVDGLPLRTNPAIVALLNLLRLMLPRAGDAPEPALPRRAVIETWRSPYFDWSAQTTANDPTPIDITPADADALDAVARWGRVVGGLAQWTEALDDLAALAPEVADDEERGRSANVPVGPAAQALQAKFQRFVRRLTPPPDARSYRDLVGWLETLVGPDPTLGTPRFPVPREPTALRVVIRARDAGGHLEERDVAALQALKDVLRGLVWAEEALDTRTPVDFPRFLDELVGAVEAVTYRLPVCPGREEIVVADVIQARGVPFQAVAVLGLAEGEFPATLSEDPFLRDADRRRLQERGLALEPSTESAEHEFFYEAIARPRERLLLTRPRLADNGARWSASPFWEEVCRLVDVEPERLSGEVVPSPDQAASWPELMESLAARPGPAGAAMRAWVQRTAPARQETLDAAAQIFQLRRAGAASPFDGGLEHLADEFTRWFGLDRAWSASRLEAYRTCPFWFFVGSVLDLETRQEPTEGLDVRQLGNLYHRLLEHVYQAAADPADPAQVLAALPAVATRVLNEAPRREGFRETAWWAQTRAEIQEHVRRSLEALAALPGDFAPLQHEATFGLQGHPPLVVRDGEDRFCLRGLIDRVDRDPAGCLRIIDYKTGGPYAFTRKAVAEGKKLQLPLYALAARDALRLGEPVEGFYWHVRHAQHSEFTLSGFGEEPEAALAVAVSRAWEAVRGARTGRFQPHPPDGGCPSYCPAASFCWHYRAGFGG